MWRGRERENCGLLAKLHGSWLNWSDFNFHDSVRLVGAEESVGSSQLRVPGPQKDVNWRSRIGSDGIVAQKLTARMVVIWYKPALNHP